MQRDNLVKIYQAFGQAAERDYQNAVGMPGAFYTDARLCALEQDYLFAKDWVCVGREEDVPQSGSYLTVTVADEPILIVRGNDGVLRGLSNVCRHRGTQVMSGRGRTETLRCPYHSWTYDLQGRLIRAPHMEQQAGFASDECTLPPIAIETWLGFVFVSLVSSPKPLAPELEPLQQKLRNYHLESMQTFYSVEWMWQTNWKSLMENFMEGYHLSPLHHNTLHPVNPTRLCKHYPPGKQYFGYEVGFAERVSGTHRGHPDLTDEERNTCIMAAIPPGFAIGVGSDYSSYLCLTPAGADAVHIRSGLFRFSDDWPSSATDDAIRLFEETMQEDKAVLEPMHRALTSRFYQPGPLAGADLEGPLVDFHRYLVSRLSAPLKSEVEL